MVPKKSILAHKYRIASTSLTTEAKVKGLVRCIEHAWEKQHFISDCWTSDRHFTMIDVWESVQNAPNRWHKTHNSKKMFLSWAFWPAEMVLTRMPYFLPASNASTCSVLNQHHLCRMTTFTMLNVNVLISLLTKVAATFWYKGKYRGKIAGKGKELIKMR
jgi:hypothetical protein